MGIFSKIFGAERKAYDTTVFEAVLAQGSANAAGINVTPTLALNCTTVAAGVRVRVETLGSLSLLLYRRGPDDERSRATDHPLYRLLHDRPNSFTSAAEFVMQIESDVILEGEGFALANRVEGRIVELLRLNPTSVTCKHDDDTLEPYYEVRNKAGLLRRYAWPDVLHIRGSIDLANNKGGRPLSALRQASQAIGLAMALEGHASRIMSKSARPGGAISATKKIDDIGWKRVRQSWQGHTGDAAGGVALLEEGMTFKPLTFSSVDLQFAEMRIFQTVEIGRALGIPPTLVYEMGRATFANSEELAQNFKTFTLLGRCKLWQGAISRLLTEEEQAEFYPEFEIDSLVKADLSARYAAYTAACGGPWLTPDEARATDNRASIKGGDVLRPPANATGVTAAAPTTKPKPGLAVAA